VQNSATACHGSSATLTIWEVFEAEWPKLVPYAGQFDGFHAVPASVSKTCLVRFDNMQKPMPGSRSRQWSGCRA
jgi:hypothetical protein